MARSPKFCHVLLNRLFLTHAYAGGKSSNPSRQLCMHTINDNLYLCTDKPRKIEIDQTTLKFKQVKENNKPLVVIISWFNGRKSQVNKYSKLYTDQGLDVLVGRISLLQAIVMLKSTERFGQNIIDILHSNEEDYRKIFVHSFSVGGMIWGLSQKMMMRNMEKYGGIPNRVIGQVWDSMTHSSMIVNGVPYAILPNNKFLQNILRKLLHFYLKHNHAMQIHFEGCIQNLYQSLATSPQLIFASEVDQIATTHFAKKLADTWKANGAEVTLKVFEDSLHVKHYQKYPDVYMQYLTEHWYRTKLVEKN